MGKTVNRSSFLPLSILTLRGILLAAAMGCAMHGHHVYAQDTVRSLEQPGELRGDAPETEQSSEPQAGPKTGPETAPEPVPQAVPRSLRDLIPDSAVEDAESWATDGTAPVAEEPPVAADQFDPVAEELENLEIVLPLPLSPDPEVEALAEIDAPDLIELPDLDPQRISDDLILAFPTDRENFPEGTTFVERFKALSTVEELETGDDTIAQLAARARADQDLLERLLRNYGYYDGQVIRQISGRRAGEEAADPNPSVRFDILPGLRYDFGAIDLGALDQAPDYEELRASFDIQTGQPLYNDRIVEEVSSLDSALGEQGYPFAEIAEPELLIDHDRREGDLNLPVQPGGKYVFGDVTSSQPEFLSGRHLARIARFEPGDTYQRSLAFDLRRAVTATGLVSSVTVTPREITPPQGDQPGVVAMDVGMEQAKLRTIAGAVGFGSEDGLKVEASWEHRNFFPPEGALKLRGILGTREQLASVSYVRNNFRARDQVLTVDAYGSDIETEAVDARTIGMRGTFERLSNLLFQKPFSWAIGAEILYTDERNAGVDGVESPREEYVIGGVFGRATIDASDDLLDPTKGYRLTGVIAPDISRSNGKTSFYARGEVSGSYYRSLGSTVIASRFNLATIKGASVQDIAPSRRLYAGGGGSVRGYGYQAIGPRDPDTEEPVGGRSRVERSWEARIEPG
ncbi:MAG: BamA/TamA family outer membrane protein, partial [Pseudomonadota bacterium]